MKKTTFLLNFVLLSTSLIGISSYLSAQEPEYTSEAYPQAQVLTEIMERQARESKGERETISNDHPFVKALSSAYSTNPDLKAAYKAQMATNEAVPIAKSGFRPTIGLSSSTTKNVTRPDTQDLPGSNTISDTTTTGGVSLKQSILAGGSTIASVNSAEETVGAGFEGVRSSEQVTLLNAVSAYLGVWVSRATLELNKINEDILKKTLVRAEARAEVGELTLTDVSQAKSQLADAAARRISAEQQVMTAEATYMRIIGEEPTSLEPPPPLELLIEFPETLEEFLAIVQRNNPDILKALATERASEHDIDAQKGSLLPSLDFSANAQRVFNNQDTRDNAALLAGGNSVRGASGTNSTSAGLTLTIPIFQTGSEWARLRQLHQTSVQRKVEARSTANSTRESAVNYWAQWKAAKEKIPQNIVRVKAAEISLQGARQESLVGERTLLDVLDTEKDLVQAQTELVSSVRDYLLYGYYILASMGQLNVDKLKLPVQRVDVRKHYEEVKDRWVGLGTIEE